jgi:hypothetical protein
MTIVNRRNALLGWIAWQGAKTIAKRKARAAVPGKGDYVGLNKSAIVTIVASVVAAVAGAAWFWRKSSNQAAAPSD